MSQQKTILKNAFFSSISDVILNVFTFLFILYAARSLSVADFGLLSFATAFISLFMFLTDMGLSALSIREMAKDRTKSEEYMKGLLGAKTLLNTSVYVFMIAVALLLGYDNQKTLMIALLGLSMVFESMRFAFEGLFRSHESLRYTMEGRVLNAITLLGSALILYNLGLGVYAFALAFILGRASTILHALLVCTRDFFTPKISFCLKTAKNLLLNSWAFGMTLFFTSIFHWIDQVMIDYFQDTTAVGYYSVAYKLILGFHFIPLAFNRAIYPVLSKTAGTESFKAHGGTFIKYMLVLGLPVGVGLSMLANPLTTLLFGETYGPSGPVLGVLSYSFILVCFSSPLHRMLEATGRQRRVLEAITAGLILNILLNLILIPRYGYLMAAYTTVATEAVFFLIPLVVVVKNRLSPQIQVKTIFKAVTATILMAAAIKATQNQHVILTIITAKIVYISAILATGLVSKQDLVKISRSQGK